MTMPSGGGGPVSTITPSRRASGPSRVPGITSPVHTTGRSVVGLRDEGDPLPAGIVVLSPWTDLAGTGDSLRSKAQADPMLGSVGMANTARYYAGEHDLKTLVAAVHGEQGALFRICERYRMPALAVAIQSCDDLEHAYACVPPQLTSLCRQLLEAWFPPEQWAARLVARVVECSRMSREEVRGVDETNPSIRSGLEAIPRIARRRAVAAALPNLPLPELTAILLQYVDHRPPSAMVGLVDDTEEKVCRRLITAHDLLLPEIRVHHDPS